MEQWANGMFMSSSPEETISANFEALAEVRVLQRLYDMTYEDFVTALKEE